MSRSDFKILKQNLGAGDPKAGSLAPAACEDGRVPQGQRQSRDFAGDPQRSLVKNFGVGSKRILLVGCGQIGSRHLQAVSCLKEVVSIDVVDCNEGSLALGQTRLKEMLDKNSGISYRWLKSIESSANEVDLCIVATSACGRTKLIKEIFERTGVKKFIIEKLVAQSLEEYQELMDFAQRQNLNIWVNCPTRSYAVHQYIKSQVDPLEPFIFSQIGGNFGLACNGIHYADLFLFYDQADDIVSTGATIDPILHPSKRGKDFFDLSGTLTGYSFKGSKIILSYASDHVLPDVVTIITKRSRFMVDIISDWAVESSLGGPWQKILAQSNTHVSYTTQTFCADIFSQSSCALPTLQECWPAHRYILTETLPHFNRLLKTKNQFCPTT